MGKSLRLSLDDDVMGAFHFLLYANLHIMNFYNDDFLIE